MADEDFNPSKADAPELSETAAAIARGRKLLRQAEQVAEKADHQAEGAQAAADETDRVLDRAQQSLDKMDNE